MATEPAPTKSSTGSLALLWTGRVISGLVVAAFTMSGVMKFLGGEQLEQGFEHLGLPLSIAVPLGVLELICVAVYAIPQTAVVGAILLTGYIGGTILTHWRVGDNFVLNIVIGVVLWIGLYLRERRLWELIPWRRAGHSG